MSLNDPNKKNQQDRNESVENDSLSEGVYVYNDDGTPMDTSERTYISTDLPDEGGDDEAEEE